MEEEPTRSELGSSLIKQLASCDQSSRDKALSSLLDSWLPSQTLVSDDLMKRLWKGLFYCVWHADKSPAQSRLADRLSSLLLELDIDVSINYLSVFFLTMRREWPGIDVLRLDKFYLLIRMFVNKVFNFLRNNSWDLELSRRLIRVLEENVFFCDDKFQGNGVKYHIASVFVDEITGYLPIRSEIAEVVFRPFVDLMGKLSDKVLVGKVKSNVFDVLVKKGREFFEIRKSGQVVEPGSDVVLLGEVALSMGFSRRFYELGCSVECCQGNRKTVFGVHEEFEKLEKDFASSGLEISGSDFVEEERVVVVPELVPISSDDTEVVVKEESALRKCCGKGKKEALKEKKKKKSGKKKNSSVERDDILENEVNGDNNLVSLDEVAMSNLQLQFEKIAAEAGLDSNDVPSSCDSPISDTKSSVVSKKRKRAKATNGKRLQYQNSVRSVEEDVNTNGNNVAEKIGEEKSVKKVKFSMNSNLVWKPQNPLPPQSLRLPPSATPRGSALKKGVPAGPIREVVPTQPKSRARARAVSVKKARKGVKRLKKKSVTP